MIEYPPDSEQHRHRCEVRDWISRRVQHDAQWLRGWLDTIEKKRGKPAADLLRTDIASQWMSGNRGTSGDWK